MSSITIIATQPATALDAQKFRYEIGQISRQSAVFFAGTMFTSVAAYAFKIYLARALGAEALGIYALGMTAVGTIGLVAALGLPSAAARFVAVYTAREDNERLRALLLRSLEILLITNLLGGVGMFLARHSIAQRIYHTPSLAKYMVLFALIMLSGAFTTFLGQVLAGYKDVARRTVITNFVGSPLTMLLSLALLLVGAGLWGYLIAQVSSAFVVLLLLARSAWKLTPPQARSWRPLGPALEQEVTRFSMTLFAAASLEFLLAQFDKILLGHYLDVRTVGIYAVAGSVTAMLAIILQSVNSIFGPTIADLHAQGDYKVLGHLFETLTKWILGLSIPLILLFMIWSRSLMGLFGADFQAGSPLLIILCFGQAINCGTGSVGYLLLMSGHQKEMIRGQLIFGILLLLADWSLIPVAGVRAAAVVSALGTAAINLYCLVVVRRRLGLFPYTRSYLKLAGPALAAAVTIWVARIAAVANHSAVVPSLMFALVLGYGIFLASLLLFGLDDDDRALIELGRARISAMFAGYSQN